VRAAFLVAPDPEDDSRKFFLPLKFNLGPRPSGFAYCLEALAPERQAQLVALYAAHLEEEDRQRLAGQLFRVRWLGRADADPNKVVSDGARNDREPNKVDQAADWLKGFLGRYAWPSEEVVTAGEKAGYSRGTLFKAKKKVGSIRASKAPRFNGE